MRPSEPRRALARRRRQPRPGQHAVHQTEDNDADTLKPRLLALGADEARAFAWDSEKPPPRLPEQLTALEDFLAASDARLLVLDPLLAMIDAGIVQNNHAVRALLDELARMAARRRCAMLLLRHLTKARPGQVLYRGAGAMAFSAACRLVSLVARDPHDAACAILATQKNNLAEAPPSLSYRWDKTADGAQLIWLGATPWSADELSRRRRDRTARTRQQARALLQKLLAEGPQFASQIWSQAKRRRLSVNTVNRAKKELKVRSERVDYRARRLHFWLLPHQELPPHLKKHAPDGLQPWLDALKDGGVRQILRPPQDTTPMLETSSTVSQPSP